MGDFFVLEQKLNEGCNTSAKISVKGNISCRGYRRHTIAANTFT